MGSSRATYATARQQVFGHYGWLCWCCGTWRSLTIDHVNGDGKEHRAEHRITTTRQFYRWLIVNNFPPGFRTLCFPCNNSKRRGRFCKLHNKFLANPGGLN